MKISYLNVCEWNGDDFIQNIVHIEVKLYLYDISCMVSFVNIKVIIEMYRLKYFKVQKSWERIGNICTSVSNDLSVKFLYLF